MRPLMITGSVTFCACARSLLGSFSKHSGKVSKANGTGLDTKPSLLARRSSGCPAPAFGGRQLQLGLVEIPAFHLTLAGWPARPPKGKMLVTNGNSPTVTR